ncbi:MAG: prepilin-type N-terminal cleavage/methylation domain-containing protein [Planctomycetes bacterium]|nr:prepilin-type N-terminal cleavage/methylation domain-containing protein [Planctomycetota bacterium]
MKHGSVHLETHLPAGTAPRGASCTRRGDFSHPAAPCVRHGFTLIELLVVVAIVALLVAMLLPSMKLARYAAQLVKCQSNMHQQYVAQISYSADAAGWFVPRNEDSPDYQRRSGNANSIVNLMRGTYVANTTLLTCPIVAKVPNQANLSVYSSSNWTNGAYGGWDSSAANVYTAYMWMAGYSGGGRTLAMIGSEPRPPLRASQIGAAVTFITHRINFYNSNSLHEISHGGRGLAVSGAPYSDYLTDDNPVLTGDGGAFLHTRGEIAPRMCIGGNYPVSPGYTGTYLW